MAESDIEAKNIHTKKIEELLVGPIFDIFHVQRAQLAEKTESQNSLLFHFKSSMAKVRTWNASTVKTFVSNLVERFPVLGAEFEAAFEELQQVTCRILNASSEVNTYEPLVASSHTHLHELISACADSFISFPEWFAVDDKSAEYQTCKNNAKVRMGQASVVPNTVMAFIKTSHREPAEAEDANSDMDIFEDDQSANSDISDISSIRGDKKINVKSGLVTQETPGEEDQAAADVEVKQAWAAAAEDEGLSRSSCVGTESVPDVQDVTAEDEIRVDEAGEASASAAEDEDAYEDADDSMGSDESDEFTVTMDSDESFSGISLGSSEDDSESSVSSSAEEGSGDDSEDSSDGMDYESASTGGESESTEEYSESSDESSDGSAASTEDYGDGESEGGGSESTEEFDDESYSCTEASSEAHSESSDSHVSGESSDTTPFSDCESEITLNWESVSDGSSFTAEGSDADFDV